MIYKKIGILGPIFYILSIIYSVIYYFILLIKFLFAGDVVFIDKITMTSINVLFVGIHFSILFFVTFIALVGFTIGYIGKDLIKDNKKNKELRISMQTMKYRFLIPIFYSLLPIPMYVYYITKLKILMPFAFFPIWFIFLYKYVEKKIKNYEIKIGSPMVKNHNTRMF